MHKFVMTLTVLHWINEFLRLLGRGLVELVQLDVESIALNRLGLSHATPKDRFEWDHLGKMLFFLAVHGFVFFFLNICFEYRQLCYFLFKRSKPPMVNNAFLSH